MPTIEPIALGRVGASQDQARAQALSSAASQAASSSTGAVGKKDAAQKFEAFVLQSFVQEMLPKDADTVFGGGLAGDYWRSMMAERLGDVMAETGSIGIADIVRKSVKLHEEAAKTGLSGTTAASLSPAGLSSAMEADGAASALAVLSGSATDGE